MSRVAKAPIAIASGTNVTIDGQNVTIKGSKGEMSWSVHPDVMVNFEDNEIRVVPNAESKQSWAHAGTTRALLNNMVQGCTEGFQKKLTLIGVGYRAQAKGKVLNLNLGFSHPIDYDVPEGINIETPSQTEIVVSGTDKQRVGQVAAEIRSYRPPEPYKGKGVRYADEQVMREEAKKK